MEKRFMYDVKLVVQHTTNGTLDFITRSFEAIVEMQEHDYFVPFVVSNDSVKEEMQKALEEYALKHEYAVNELYIVTTEVSTNDDMIDISFSDNLSDNIYERDPEIEVEFIPHSYKPMTPQLFRGYDEVNAILWKWENVPNCAFRMYDQDNNIVAEMGVDILSYHETDIVRGENYVRRLVAFNTDGESEPTPYVTVSLSKEEYDDSLLTENRFGYIDITPIEETKVNIPKSESFKSGIGDNTDLHTRSDTQTIYESFEFDAIVDGEVVDKQRHHTEIAVDYKIVATGEKETDGPINSITDVSIKPWPISTVEYSADSTIIEPIDLSYQLDIDVAFQKQRPQIDGDGGIGPGTGGSGGGGGGTPGNPDGKPTYPGGNWVGGIGTDENHDWELDINGEIFKPGDIIWDQIGGGGSITINPDGTITGDRPGNIIIEGTLPNGDKVVIEGEVLPPVIGMPDNNKPGLDETGKPVKPVEPALPGTDGDGGGSGGGIVPTPDQEGELPHPPVYPPDIPGLPEDHGHCPCIYLYETTTIPLKLTSGNKIMNQNLLELDHHKEPPVFDYTTTPPTYVEGCLCCMDTDDMSSVELITELLFDEEGNEIIDTATGEQKIKYYLKGNHVGRSHFRGTYKGNYLHFNVHVVKLETWIVPDPHTMRVGETVQYKLYKAGYKTHATPTLVNNSEIDWSIDQNATIKENGIALGEQVGDYNVTAIHIGKTAEATGTITPPDMHFDYSTSLTDAYGKDLYATRVGLRVLAKVYVNEKLMSNSNISFKIADESVATISPEGYIYGEDMGETELEATYKGFTIKTKIIVYSRIITIEPSSFELFEYGKQEVKVYDEGVRVSDSELSFRAEHSSIASVNSSGIVTGEKAGDTKIIATYKGINLFSSCKIKTSVLEIVRWTMPANFTIFTHQSEIVRCKLNNYYVPQNDTNLTYSSSNSGIATVSSNGSVKGITPGVITLTAKYKNLTATRQVTVELGNGYDRYRIIENGSLSTYPHALVKGITRKFTLQVLDETNRWVNITDDRPISWRINDDDSIPCVNGMLTEMDHKSIVGWTSPCSDLVTLINPSDPKSNSYFDATHDTVYDIAPSLTCTVVDELYGELNIGHVTGLNQGGLVYYTIEGSPYNIGIDSRLGKRRCIFSIRLSYTPYANWFVNLDNVDFEFYDPEIAELKKIDDYQYEIVGKLSGLTTLIARLGNKEIRIKVEVFDFLEVTNTIESIDVLSTHKFELMANGKLLTYDGNGDDRFNGYQIIVKPALSLLEDGTIKCEFYNRSNYTSVDIVFKRNNSTKTFRVNINEPTIFVEVDSIKELPKVEGLYNSNNFGPAYVTTFDSIRLKCYVNDILENDFIDVTSYSTYYFEPFYDGLNASVDKTRWKYEKDGDKNVIMKRNYESQSSLPDNEAFFTIKLFIRGGIYKFNLQTGQVHIAVPDEVELFSRGSIQLINEKGNPIRVSTYTSRKDPWGKWTYYGYSAIAAASYSANDNVCENAIKFYNYECPLDNYKVDCEVILGSKEVKIKAIYGYKTTSMTSYSSLFYKEKQFFAAPQSYDRCSVDNYFSDKDTSDRILTYPFVIESDVVKTTMLENLPNPVATYYERYLQPNSIVHSSGRTSYWSEAPIRRVKIRCRIGSKKDIYYTLSPIGLKISDLDYSNDDFKGYIGQSHIATMHTVQKGIIDTKMQIAGIDYGEMRYETTPFIMLRTRISGSNPLHQDHPIMFDSSSSLSNRYYINALSAPYIYDGYPTGNTIYVTTKDTSNATIASNSNIIFKNGKCRVPLEFINKDLPSGIDPLYVYAYSSSNELPLKAKTDQFVLVNSLYKPVLEYEYGPVEYSKIQYMDYENDGYYVTENNDIVLTGKRGYQYIGMKYLDVSTRARVYAFLDKKPPLFMNPISTMTVGSTAVPSIKIDNNGKIFDIECVNFTQVSSSDSSVIRVSDTNVLVAQKVGTATITVKFLDSITTQVISVENPSETRFYNIMNHIRPGEKAYVVCMNVNGNEHTLPTSGPCHEGGGLSIETLRWEATNKNTNNFSFKTLSNFKLEVIMGTTGSYLVPQLKAPDGGSCNDQFSNASLGYINCGIYSGHNRGTRATLYDALEESSLEYVNMKAEHVINEITEFEAKYAPPIIPGYFLKRKTLPFTKSEVITETIVNRKELEVLPYVLNDSEIAAAPRETVVVENVKLVRCNTANASFSLGLQEVYMSIDATESVYNAFIYGVVAISIEDGRHKQLFNPDTLIYKNSAGEIYRGSKLPTTKLTYTYTNGEVEIKDSNGTLFPEIIRDRKPYLTLSLIEPDAYRRRVELTDSEPTKILNVKTLFTPPLEDKVYIMEILVNNIRNATTAIYDSKPLECNKVHLISTDVKPDLTLELNGIPTIVILPYREESLVMTGKVNGKLPMVNNYDGYKPYVTVAPAFDLVGKRVIDARFEVVIIDSESKPVVAKFDGSSSAITAVNGDRLTITSDYTELVDVLSRILCTISKSKEFEITSHNKERFISNVYNPLHDERLANLTIRDFKVSASSKNPNVVVYPVVHDISFTQGSPLVVPWEFEAFILSPSQSCWSPLIYPGYYYMNNDEYFLYKSHKPKTGFAKKEVPVDQEFMISIEASLDKKTASLDYENDFDLSSGNHSGTIINNGRLMLSPSSNDALYETHEMLFVDGLNEVELKVFGTLLQTSLEISINENGVWSSYEPYTNSKSIYPMHDVIDGVKLRCRLTRGIDEETPIITRIRVKGLSEKWEPYDILRKVIVCTVKMDMTPHEITNKTLFEIMNTELRHSGKKDQRIKSILVKEASNKFTMDYEEDGSTKLVATSTTKEMVTVDANYVDFDEEGNAVVSPIPRLGRPIIVKRGDKYLRHVTEYDEECKLTHVQTDKVIFNGVLAMALSYHDIDQLTVKNGDDEVPVKTIVNNMVYFEPTVKIELGAELVAHYHVKNSFYVDYNYDIAKSESFISVYLSEEDNDFNDIEVFYETHDTGEYYAKEIEINTLYNSLNSGFIYIADSTNHPDKIELHSSQKEFSANTMEHTYVFALVIDKFGNAVPNAMVDVAVDNGEIIVNDEKTNKLGIISIKYKPPSNYVGEDFITVSCPGYDVTSNIKFTIRDEVSPRFLVVKATDNIFEIPYGQKATISIDLYQDGLIPCVGEQIRAMVMDRPDTTVTQVTDKNGNCKITMSPLINTGLNTCRIEITSVDIVEYIDLKVVI